MQPTRAETRRVVHYVTGEVCVAVASRDQQRRLSDEYEAVRRGLNDMLARASLDQETFKASDFAADLQFDSLRERLHGAAGDGLLQALDLTSAESHAAPDRSVLLPPPVDGSAPAMALHFYRLPEAPRRTVGDDPAVRELATFLDLDGGELASAAAGRSWWVEGVTPNWMMAGAPEDETTGGPGAKPEPGEAKSTRFRFANADLAAQIAEGDGDGVVVAVLDTSPTKRQVRAAARDGRGNWLLREVAGRVEIDGPLSISRQYFSRRLRRTAVRWHVPLPTPAATDGDFKMPDHGLFVAGIIHSLVPRAQIHLIRVLGDFGSGDLLALVSTLTRMPDALLRDAAGKPNGKRLVVNMSLMADLPPGVSLEARSPRGDQPPSKDFLDFWLPATSTNKSETDLHALLEQPQNAAVAQSIKRTHLSLQHAVQSLQMALLVGAAGNDALGRSGPPPTRLPARYDEVLGVGAVRRSGQEAQYSNRGDEHEMGDGVATIGGDARLAAPNAPPEIAGEWITGVFSADHFPLGGAQNHTGWARWAGTSFATPIISGIAASVWSIQPALAPRDVMDRVRGFREGQNAVLTCPWIRAEQEP